MAGVATTTVTPTISRTQTFSVMKPTAPITPTKETKPPTATATAVTVRMSFVRVPTRAVRPPPPSKREDEDDEPFERFPGERT